MATISIQKIEKSALGEVDLNNLDFGKVFCDHMLVAKYSNGKWGHPEIKPYGDLSLSPSSSVLHYGQAVFEGMKAYRTASGDVEFFRMEDNFARMNQSAKRMSMPEIPKEIFIDALHSLVDLDQNWIPPHRESALYIRPFLIAVDEFIGVKPANNYLFIVITCPVNAYYTNPLKIKIEQQYVRAAHGGVGEAKAAGNYAAAMFATKLANAQGYDQLLWTDAKEHKWIEELGTSNFFCIVDNEIWSPKPSGTILQGVTRDSVIQIAKKLDYSVVEKAISVEELVDACRQGKVSEAFATGTAAALTPIESISYLGEELKISTEGEVRKPLFEYLLKIRKGEVEDSFGWMTKLVAS